MLEFIVDVSAVTSWSDFIAAINDGFVRRVGGNWNGNLDAFNDYLSWPEENRYRLVIRGWSICECALSSQKTPDGRPVIEIVEEIFQDNPYAEVVMA